ncbi:MAG: D-Ala-D-Ala carboxypeptidase family metallohydrolase, partial [Actinomycetota bacterium]|nr:D-Ala-D-Ala carboxypeptidase family metallohydrolase [Actinomycetota bacterium]
LTPRPHPQAVNPTAGQLPAAPADPGPTVTGDVNAHAPSLAEVRHELQSLNLCGGTTNSANAQPLVKVSAPGFVADPGTSQTEGELPRLTAQLNALARSLGVVIYGISGYRSPAHSVAVGGFANDPHTQGMAEDIGVNSLLRSSAAQISEAQLARFGLYRPFDPTGDPNNPEVNHLQPIPAGGPLSLAQSTAAFDPDPNCR